MPIGWWAGLGWAEAAVPRQVSKFRGGIEEFAGLVRGQAAGGPAFTGGGDDSRFAVKEVTLGGF